MNKIVLLVVLLMCAGCAAQNANITEGDEIKLPNPTYDGAVSLEKTLSERKSERSFTAEPLSLNEISQLLWASQGIDAVTGATRTAPSAGALHPLEIYFIITKQGDLEPGVYHYSPSSHTIKKVADAAERLAYDAPMYLVFTAVYERTTRKYGARGERYVHIEAGHAAQNVHLQAISLGLKTVPVGAFDDDYVSGLLGLDEEAPLYVVVVGK
ncbi:SagB/ThcOx family dehydrogenase [Candidatus Woesearchaeota archaeon]|nr:SagB/ThcOx family dehydrogenase [Candidatus Woesearchaeota archaeon]